MRCIYADPDNLNKFNKSDSGLLAQIYLQLSKSGLTISIMQHCFNGFQCLQPRFATGSKPGWLSWDTIPQPRREPRKAASLHSLQSCKPGARVLDQYAAYTTAPRVWRWVFGGSTRRGGLQARSHSPGVRRPSWHVEPTHRARVWRFLLHLNQAISVLPGWRRRMNGSCQSDTVLRALSHSRLHRQSSLCLSTLSGGGSRHEYHPGGDIRPCLV
jgi:hypothetical protein